MRQIILERNCIYIDREYELKAIISLLEECNYKLEPFTECYIDAKKFSSMEIALQTAKKFHDSFSLLPKIFEPCVLGNLPLEEYKIREKAAQNSIRTSSLSFEQYLEKLRV